MKCKRGGRTKREGRVHWKDGIPSGSGRQETGRVPGEREKERERTEIKRACRSKEGEPEMHRAISPVPIPPIRGSHPGVSFLL